MKLKLPRNYRDVVDELGAVQARLANLAPVIKPLGEREKGLRAQVLSWCEQMPADAEQGLEGARYALAISPRRTERTITSMARLVKRLGLALFLKGCSISLKYIDEHLAAVDQKGLISEARTGTRVLTTSPRMAAVKNKAV